MDHEIKITKNADPRRTEGEKTSPEFESMMSIGVRLHVLEMAALLREINKIREDHAAIADMEERLRGTGFDVLLAVIVQASLDGVPDVAE